MYLKISISFVKIFVKLPCTRRIWLLWHQTMCRDCWV